MFRATHCGGPLDGNDVDMSARTVPVRLFYAPAPDGVPDHVTASGYMLVGYDQAPEASWPGQVEYALDPDASELRPHHAYDDMQEGTAVFTHAGDA